MARKFEVAQEMPLPMQVEIPGFGRTRVIQAENASGCVDSRTSLKALSLLVPLEASIHNNKAGAERSPGASEGKVMSLMGATKVEVVHAVDVVAKWEKNQGRAFTYHQDDVTLNGLGCKHVDLASDEEHETLYGLPSSQVREMQHIIPERVSGDMQVEIPILTGSLQKNGILIVDSSDKTVMPKIGNPQGEDYRFLRFDRLRHDRRLENLARFAQREGIDVKGEALIAAANRQRAVTSSLLAPGVNIYEIDLTSYPVSQVVYKGKVPSPGKLRKSL